MTSKNIESEGYNAKGQKYILTDSKSSAELQSIDVPLPPRPPTIIPNPPQQGTVANLEMDDTDLVNQQELAKQKMAAMEKAHLILSKFKNNIHRKTNPTSKKSWLIHTVQTIVTSVDKVIQPHHYRFVNSREAAKFNTKILKRSKYDLSLALKKEKGSMMEPGSEFRSKPVLEPLFIHHEFWEKMGKIVSEGVSYPMEDIAIDEQKSDLLKMIDRGNHKSATQKENNPTLVKNYDNEVKHGWMLPVTIESLNRIKGAAVIPIGVAQQSSIDADGNKYTKRRTTHDASFPPPSGKSINNRLVRELLEPCFYGHCLIRFLHAIHQMRLHHPQIRILLIKIDLDAAYRRLHVTAKMAVLTITILQKIAYILLRLPFGVANGPSDYCQVSEPIMDLTNDILRDDSWEPSELHSPLCSKFEEPSNSYTPDAPFAKARKLFVPAPFYPAITDGYIDDIITAVLEMGQWLKRAQNAAPLAIHTVFRPTNPKDPLPRSDATSERKLKGEGTPDERKTILGWLVDTRLFRIFLPEDKAKVWIKELKRMLKLDKIPMKMLESSIGRLNHAGHILPQGRYFLNRLRHLLQQCKASGPQPLEKAQREDIKLWIKILHKVSSKGVDINNITFTYPTHTCYSDACEHGMGGYNCNGLAWRYKLPTALVGKFSINLLEFIASAITIHLTIRSARGSTKILAFTDNSSALGWLYKASFAKCQPVHDTVARWLATTLMNNNAALYSQHIRGKHNFIADVLSRDDHISNEQLTYAFNSLIPAQTPKSFNISPLPPDIVCWIHSLHPSLTKTLESPPPPSRSKLGALTNGDDSSSQWESLMNGLKITQENKEHICYQHLRAAAEEISLAQQIDRYSPEGLSSPPSHMYARPFGRIFSRTQPSTQTTNLPYSSRDNSQDS